jgi:glycosyltransferase involved in cell wall biosynthesis
VKVCFLTANWPPEARGGTEQVVSALAAELRQRRVEVCAISGSERPGRSAVRTEEVDGVVVHRLSREPGEHGHGGTVHPRFPALVQSLLAQHRPDVVHVHSFSALGLGLTPVAKALRMRVAVTFHDLWVTCPRFFRVPVAGITCPSGSDRTPCVPCINASLHTDPALVELGLAERDRLLRAELGLADVCIAPSVSAARAVREHLPYAERIAVVPHGLVRPVDAESLAALRRPGEMLRVGTFGGLVRVKGLRELVEAVAGLPIELHLAGPFHEPDFEDEIRTLASTSGTPVHLRGRYGPEERHPARDLHLAVFPSKCQETYGLVVDEALAHGVPVVCSDAGALRERADTGGVVVTPVAQLADVLRSLVTSPDRLAALRAAIPATLPTIAAAAERHLELYQRLR